MYSFDYIGSNGKLVNAAAPIDVLSKSKGILSLSASIGDIKALNLDAAKRGMCALRKQHLRSVDALALGIDNRLYFIEFKDRNFRTLSAQGKGPVLDEQGESISKRKDRKFNRKKSAAEHAKNAQEATIEVELSEKLFDSILLAGLGEEKWSQVDFIGKFGGAGSYTLADIRRQSVFVLVYNDVSYDKDATSGELKILSVGKKLAESEGQDDPQIQGARIYWGIEKFSKADYCSEVHTLNIPEFERYAADRFRSL